jgi:hypothetical protein
MDGRMDGQTAALGRQRLAMNNIEMVSARSVEQQLNSNRGTVFSLRSVPRCYKQDNLEKE